MMVRKFIISGILALSAGFCAWGAVFLYQHYDSEAGSEFCSQDVAVNSDIAKNQSNGQSASIVPTVKANKSRKRSGHRAAKAIVDAPVSYRDKFPEAVLVDVLDVQPSCEDIGPTGYDTVLSEDVSSAELDKSADEAIVSAEQDSNTTEDSSDFFFGDYRKPKSSYSASRDEGSMGNGYNAYIDPLYTDNFFAGQPYNGFDGDSGFNGMSPQSSAGLDSDDGSSDSQQSRSKNSSAKNSGSVSLSSPRSRLVAAATNSAEQATEPVVKKEAKESIVERKKSKESSPSESDSSDSVVNYNSAMSVPDSYQNMPYRQLGNSTPISYVGHPDAGNSSEDDAMGDDSMDDQLMPEDDEQEDQPSFLGSVKGLAKTVAGIATPIVANKLISSAWQSLCNWYNPAAAQVAQNAGDGQAQDGVAADAGVPVDGVPVAAGARGAAPVDQSAVGGGVRAALSKCFAYVANRVAGAMHVPGQNQDDAAAAAGGAGVAPGAQAQGVDAVD